MDFRDLYFMQQSHTGAFKIGISKYPKKRLKQLQTGNPYEIRIIHVWTSQAYREHIIHKILDHACEMMGLEKTRGEWYDYKLISSLPDDLYEILDIDIIDTWWRHDKDNSPESSNNEWT